MGYFEGLAYSARGARFVYVRHPGLARFWLPPIGLTVCAFAFFAWLAIDRYDELTALIWAEPVGPDWQAAVGRFFHAALAFFVALALLVFSVLLTSLTASIVAAPFNDALSHAVERIARAGDAPGLGILESVGDAVRSIGLQGVKVTLYWSVVGPLLLGSWILPVVGPPLYAIGGFGAAALFLAMDYVDWPASRRGLSIRERLSLARRNLRALLGLGTGIWLMLFVPVLGLFFMPAAVAGGTLLFLDLEARGLTRREEGP
jgi:CysZ protein